MYKISAVLFALASSALATVVPTTVLSIQTTGSSADALQLSMQVALQVDPADAAQTLTFSFGSADGTQTFGSGSLDFTPNGSSSVTATAAVTFNPSASAAAAAQDVLSAFCSNVAAQVSVKDSATGVSYPVTVNGVGVQMVKQIQLQVTALTPITGDSAATIEMFNPFHTTLTLNSLQSTATTTLNGQSVTIGSTDATDIGFTQQAGEDSFSPLIPATTALDGDQISAMLDALDASGSIPVNTVATAGVVIGNYPTVVTFSQTIPASLYQG